MRHGRERPAQPGPGREGDGGGTRRAGAEYEPALIDSLVERIDRAVEQRVRDEVGREPARRVRSRGGGYPVPLAYVSLGTGIPITAIAGGTAGIGGIALAWLGIVGVNVAAALGSRGGDDRDR